MPGGRRDTPIMSDGSGGGGPSKLINRIGWAVAMGLLIGSVIGLLYPSRFFNVSAPRTTLPTNVSRVVSSTCKTSEVIKTLRSEYISVSEKNAELKRDIRESIFKLRLIEQGKDPVGTQFMSIGERKKAGPFGTVKGNQTNPTIIPDDSVNKRLAKLLGTIAIKRELIVTFADPAEKDLLVVWFTSLKKVGIQNYLVVTMDDEIAKYCHAKVVPYYKVESNEGNDSIGKDGSNHEVSGFKFLVLREFLRLGYSVLVSDLDTVFLQNPFEYLVRDSDVESTSDGHDNMTAYGFDDGFDDPSMGWARSVHTIRIWMYNSGFFFIRPTIPSIELVDRVASRVSQDENLWDQGVFNEELFMPSHPGHDGLYASTRSMDIHLFMNSKVLFTSVRKDANLLTKLRPVIVHVNYHSDKLERMNAIVEYYVNGKLDALRDFPDGSE